MEEIKKGEETTNEQAAPEETKTPEDEAKAREELQKTIREGLEKQRAILKEANEAIGEGKGRLRLETPIRARDKEITELVYDFTTLKGIEYTDAMDSDPNANNAFNITRRQALALFAKAASKETEGVDMQDIVSQIGITDSVEGVQLAMLFFNASARAGRMRISKKSSSQP